MKTKWFDKLTEEARKKVLQKIDTIVISIEVKEQIENLEQREIVAYVDFEDEKCIAVLPYLEKISEINKKVTYHLESGECAKDDIEKLVGHKDAKLPVVVVSDTKGEVKGILEGYPERFKKRLKGLDKEDRRELKERYRRGYYNNELAQGLLELLER